MRDHVRVTPGTRNAAAALPVEKEFDDAKLMALLESAGNELQGLRLLHLHLGLLEKTELSDTALITRLLTEIASNASELHLFNMSNGDMLMLYKGIKFSAVEDVARKIEASLLAKTKMIGVNPYKEAALYSILELSMNFVHVIRYVESIAATDAPGAAAPDAKPPIGPEELGKIDKQLGLFDLSPFLFNQAVVNIRDTDKSAREYYELYISIKELQKRLAPDFDIAGNRWLFTHFTASLDRSLLRSLNHGLDFMGSEAIGINMNLSTALSPAFLNFDERLPAAHRGKVVIEINKTDLMQHTQQYRELLEFAGRREYRICLDGLNDYWARQLDFEALGCDYAKIFWSNSLLALDPDEERAFLDRVAAARGGRCQIILARCSAVTGLLYANKNGIDLVQGHAVDAVLRKGIPVIEAIRTASLMDG